MHLCPQFSSWCLQYMVFYVSFSAVSSCFFAVLVGCVMVVLHRWLYCFFMSPCPFILRCLVLVYCFFNCGCVDAFISICFLFLSWVFVLCVVIALGWQDTSDLVSLSCFCRQDVWLCLMYLPVRFALWIWCKVHSLHCFIFPGLLSLF